MTTDLQKAASCAEKTLSDLSPKDKPWRRHKQDAVALSGMYLDTKSRYRHGQRIANCASLLVFDNCYDLTTGEYKLTLRGANFCRVRTCPVCQWRRSLLWRARFYRLLPDIFESYPTARYLFLTLTVANVPTGQLHETLKLMSKAWQRLTQRKAWTTAGVLGWVRTFEVTRENPDSYGRNGYAHPHYHAILMMPSGYFGSAGGYLSHEKWQTMWKEALRADYEPRVDVRMVKPKNGHDSKKIGGVERAGVIEALKYSVKSGDLLAEADWTVTISLQIDGLRAIATGGVFKTMLAGLDELTEAEEMVTLGDAPTVGLADDIVRFLWRDGDYRTARG